MRLLTFLCFVLFALVATAHSAQAQPDKKGGDKKENPKTEKPPKDKGGDKKENPPKDKGGDKGAAAKNGGDKGGASKNGGDKNGAPAAKADKTIVKTTANYTEMSREEKNGIDVCPLHGKKMPLSDNYRANASDFAVSDGYPFARQLCYRRCCDKCTKAMTKEEEAAKKLKNKHGGEPTFERCALHNQTLFISDQHNTMDYEKNPKEGIPHAKQYRFKTFCPTCTKQYEKANPAAKGGKGAKEPKGAKTPKAPKAPKEKKEKSKK